MSTRSVGQYFEQLAKVYLQRRGYYILKQNWRCRYGELDLIARDDKTLVIVEVKAVRSARFCSAVELFTLRKQKNIKRAIKFLLYLNPRFAANYRIDLVCLTQNASKLWIEHYKGIS